MKNKVVFVTGSSIGIGRQTVYQFARENAAVVVTYYKEKEEIVISAIDCVLVSDLETQQISMQ